MYNNSDFPNLSTKRLLLRQMTQDDADELYSFYAEGSPIIKYLDWHGPSSLEQARELIVAWNQQFQENRLLPWGITQHTDNKLIGTIMCMPVRGTFDYRPLSPVSVGFELTDAHWNKGFMSEALGAVIRHGFDRVGIHRMQAEVIPQNKNSLRLLEKFGFKQEGLLKQYLMHDVTKVFFDVIMLALLEV
jgi:ribosomal-protein-alanine N-acetyltransferase